MQRRDNQSLVIGLILVAVGLIFLAAQFIPGLGDWLHPAYSWPLIIIAVGVFLLLVAFFTSGRESAIPGCIITGIGIILYYQNATGDWNSWAYVWALIPALAGLGTLTAGLLRGNRAEVHSGLGLILTGLVLFVVFGAFFGAFGWLGPYWPLLLVGAGILLLATQYFRR